MGVVYYKKRKELTVFIRREKKKLMEEVAESRDDLSGKGKGRIKVIPAFSRRNFVLKKQNFISCLDPFDKNITYIATNDVPCPYVTKLKFNASCWLSPPFFDHKITELARINELLCIALDDGTVRFIDSEIGVSALPSIFVENGVKIMKCIMNEYLFILSWKGKCLILTLNDRHDMKIVFSENIPIDASSVIDAEITFSLKEKLVVPILTTKDEEKICFLYSTNYWHTLEYDLPSKFTKAKESETLFDVEKRMNDKLLWADSSFVDDLLFILGFHCDICNDSIVIEMIGSVICIAEKYRSYVGVDTHKLFLDCKAVIEEKRKPLTAKIAQTKEYRRANNLSFTQFMTSSEMALKVQEEKAKKLRSVKKVITQRKIKSLVHEAIEETQKVSHHLDLYNQAINEIINKIKEQERIVAAEEEEEEEEETQENVVSLCIPALPPSNLHMEYHFPVNPSSKDIKFFLRTKVGKMLMENIKDPQKLASISESQRRSYQMCLDYQKAMSKQEPKDPFENSSSSVSDASSNEVKKQSADIKACTKTRRPVLLVSTQSDSFEVIEPKKVSRSQVVPIKSLKAPSKQVPKLPLVSLMRSRAKPKLSRTAAMLSSFVKRDQITKENNESSTIEDIDDIDSSDSQKSN